MGKGQIRGRYGNYSVYQVAEGVVAFNRFVMPGTAGYQVKQCNATTKPCGAVEQDARMYNLDNTLRTGWIDGESLSVKETGEVAVEVGLGGMMKGQDVFPDANGKAVTKTMPVAGATYLQADLQAVIDYFNLRAGVANESKAAGELGLVLLK